VLVAGLLAAGLGFVGFSDASGGSTLDNAYRSLQLFAINSGDLGARTTPWTLNVARFLAPAVSIAFLIDLVQSVLRGARRRRRRGHVIVCGLGRTGRAVIAGLNQDEVLGISTDPTLVDPATRDLTRFPTLLGDATLQETLEEAGVAGCRAIVAVTGDDATNAEIAGVVLELPYDVRVLVGIRDRLLARELSGLESDLNRKIEILDLPTILARAAIAEADFRAERPGAVLILGFGTLGQAIAAELSDNQAVIPRIVAVDRAASEKTQALTVKADHLKNRISSHALEFVSREFESLEFLPRDCHTVAVFICIKDESLAIRIALQLQNEPKLHNAKIVVRVNVPGRGLALLGHQKGMKLFGPEKAAGEIVRRLQNGVAQ